MATTGLRPYQSMFLENSRSRLDAAESGRRGAPAELSSLQATLKALKGDEQRHLYLIEQLSKKAALGQTQSQHTHKSFADSGYVLVKTLGQGRFGMVKLAKKKRNNHVEFTRRVVPSSLRQNQEDHSGFVAVRIIPRYKLRGGKLVASESFSSSEKHKALMLQIDALRDLDHPNICREYETFEDDQNIYIVMELYTGGEMLERQQHMFSEARVAWCIDQVLAAMAHAHDREIVHQDLRPENILYASEDEDSRLVICDWSLAAFVGTPPEDARRNLLYTAYSAPELDYRHRTDRGDIWSIGAIAHGLLTMQPPFQGIATEDFSWGASGAEFSAECRAFVEMLLRVDPATRPSAREALQHPWLREARAACGAAQLAPAVSDAVVSMAKFRKQTNVQKAAATFAAVHLTGSKLHQLTQAFHAIDGNRDGVIDRQELEAALVTHTEHKTRGGHLSDEEDALVQELMGNESSLAALLAAMDVDGSGRVQYSEFLAAATSAVMENSVQLCWEAFRAFDMDGNGWISRQEIKSIFDANEISELISNLHTVPNNGAIKAAFEEMGGVPETADEIMTRLDTNGDDHISFEEFMEALFGKSVSEHEAH